MCWQPDGRGELLYEDLYRLPEIVPSLIKDKFCPYDLPGSGFRTLANIYDPYETNPQDYLNAVALLPTIGALMSWNEANPQH